MSWSDDKDQVWIECEYSKSEFIKKYKFKLNYGIKDSTHRTKY